MASSIRSSTPICNSRSARKSQNVHRLVRCVAVLAILIAIAPWSPRVSANQPQQIEASQEVELDFPSTATFHLSAQSPAPVTSAELRYSTSGKQYSNSGVVPFPETTDVEAEYTVDAQIDYIEPGVDITYYWVLIGPDGPVA